jgi:hypothetical protein
MFQIFHLDVAYVTMSLYACFKCFTCFRLMLQVFHLDVTKIDSMLHMLLWLYTYVSSVYFNYIICFRHTLKVFHLDVLKVDMWEHISSAATTLLLLLLGAPPWVTVQASEAGRHLCGRIRKRGRWLGPTWGLGMGPGRRMVCWVRHTRGSTDAGWCGLGSWDTVRDNTWELRPDALSVRALALPQKKEDIKHINYIAQD